LLYFWKLKAFQKSSKWADYKANLKSSSIDQHRKVMLWLKSKVVFLLPLDCESGALLRVSPSRVLVDGAVTMLNTAGQCGRGRELWKVSYLLVLCLTRQPGSATLLSCLLSLAAPGARGSKARVLP
jgi:hypothetical protein